MARRMKAFWGSVKQSARIAQKQALIKKKQLTDLKSIYTQIGEYVYTNQIGSEQMADRFAAIATLDASVQQKRQHQELGASATVADKAKHAATITKDRAAVEVLLLRRKGLLADLGEALCAYDVEDETFANLKNQAQGVEAEISQLQQEALSLEQEATGLAKKPALMGGIALLGILVLAGAIAGIRSGCARSGKAGSEQFTAGISNELADMKRDRDAAELQASKDQLEELQRQQRRETEAQQEAKRLEVENQQELAVQEQKKLAKEARDEQVRKTEALKKEQQEEQRRIASVEERQDREAEQLRREADGEARRLTEEAEVQKRQSAEQEAKAKKELRLAKEKADRAAYAKQVFSAINIKPRIYLSRTVQNSGAKIEVRGKDWSTIAKLHQDGNWLVLINHLLNQSYADCPDKGEVDEAAYRLNTYGLYIVCRTTLRNDPQGMRLYMLHFAADSGPDAGSSETVFASDDWTTHPDGNGYMTGWNPKELEGVILHGQWVGPAFEQDTRNINAKWLSEKRALQARRDLGEITEAVYNSQVVELAQRTRKATIEWARQQ